jgi:lipoprotein-releasing system permease protein
MLKLFLWLRYLCRKKIVLLSTASVALSVSLLIIVASLFSGFIDAFEQSAVQTIGDVVLSAPVKFAKYPLFIERLEKLNAVEAATATLSAQGLLHIGKGNVRAVTIWGIEPARRAKVTGFKQSMLRQKLAPGDPSFEIPPPFMSSTEDTEANKIGGFVGIGTLGEPDEKTDEYDVAAIEKMIGQPVVLTTGAVTGQKDSSSGEVSERFRRRTVEFTIADIVFTGVYDLDKRLVYLPIAQVQRILYPNENAEVADQIQIKLRDNTQAESAVAQIRGVWQVFAADQLNWDTNFIRYTQVETAKQLQSRYVVELRKQMGVLLLIFGVVSLGVVVLVFCIFYMIVRFKQRDIAIMKSCGAASSSVACIFLGFGVCVGTLGSCVGAVLGYVITKNINVVEEQIRIIFGLKLWKSSVYMFSKIPNEVDWGSAFSIVLLAVMAAAIGTLIPAVVAARTRPVEILRYE